jgi:hypothetical protein
MDNAWRGDRSYELEAVQAVTDAFEKSLSAAEQRRSEIDRHLIDEIRGEILLRRTRSAGERYVFAACSPARLFERRLDARRDEREGRSALELERLAFVMRQHEHGMMIWRICPPPTVPRLFWIPRAGVTTEHVASHDGRADVRKRFLDDASAFVDLATLHSVLVAEDRESERPLVQAHAPDTERVINALAGTSDEAVERHRDRETQLGHARKVEGGPNKTRVRL